MTSLAPAAQADKITVLVIDDEGSIRRTLEGVLSDEGFTTLLAENGEEGIRILNEIRPSLVVLDIWMPGLDGIETLKRIKQLHPNIPVIMISGHATIATAITATRLGAADFVEKPLDLHSFIKTIRKALALEGDAVTETDAPSSEKASNLQLSLGATTETTGINPIAFSNMKMRGESYPQKTLAHSAILYGQGLHSGKKSGLILEPLPPFSGIHFVGVSDSSPLPAHVDFVESTGFATTLRLGSTQAGTIEHVMSALHAYGITNLLIKCNGEVPVMDGSALEFCSLIDEIGVEEQGEKCYEILIDKPIRVGGEQEYIQVEPADNFIIDYTLNYPEPIGHQNLVFVLDDIETYKREIAPARTFGFVKDVGALQSRGLALGGRFDNFVLIGPKGPINDELRFSDEPVRHKILDAIGDLYLLGRRIRGKITARMTGHSDNILLLKSILSELKTRSE
ncbi:MAG: UDP-3-O-[3-hydroxymyristoyl] N-acetylglucosamine deacetylase [Deltaproteobacteria bacterium]|nr:UDP-3-O-[3-hydroxymyristoyl] N-acetylglucosamine deacetylase [Deltaproteobacteria bacterium]